MKSKHLFLAIDQGSHGTTALCFDETGALRSSGQTAIGVHQGAPGEVEQDATEILESVHRAVAQSLKQLGLESRQVGAVGLATQRSSIVCWSRRSLEPITPVLSWQDTRAANLLDAIEVSEQRIREITGLRKSPHYGASKIRWCLDHHAAVGRAGREGDLVCGPLSSYLAAALTGNRKPMADPCNASRTLLWDRRSRDWSAEMLDAFGIARELLPHCVGNRAAFGSIDMLVGARPLVVCTGDQSAVPFVDGDPGEGTVFINLGTGAFLQKPVAPGERTDGRLLESVVWQEGDSRLLCMEGTVNGAGAALQWLADRERIDSAELVDGLDDALAMTAAPIFLNGVSGLGSPFWASDLQPRFIGAADERAARLAAVAESIVFLVLANLSLMGSVERLVLSGGLSRSTALCQRLADLSRRPVERLEMAEATGRGLANRLAGNPGQWQPSERTVLEPGHRPDSVARYRQWQELLEAALRSR